MPAKTTTLVECTEIIITEFEALDGESARFVIEVPDHIVDTLVLQVTDLDSPVE